jgi:prepilin-type N-terminal cleavage/methylation domain-containing protein
MRVISRSNRPDCSRSAGFTLIELMMTLVIFALVAVAVTLVLQNSAKSKQRTSMHIESEQTARAALDLMARDIRTAGYGADLDYSPPQPAIAYVDSQEIILSQNQYPYPDNSAGPVAPLAYNPAANPKPFPLSGTPYTPPIRYRTGAELIRYTLDLNNDGVVDASDVATAQGADAAATPNPNDYVLAREVYGDSTNNVANDNGGLIERVALVRKPGGGVPPLFTVYMRGSSTPWDWSAGPVPANRLTDIQRVELRVTATASRPDAKGQFSQTTLKSEVNAARSVPDFGAPTYVVSGFVFNDLDGDKTKGFSEPGIAGAAVRMGPFLAYTGVSGFYQLRVPSGAYTLKHAPAPGYASAQWPDTVNLTITNTAVSHNFPDSARSGGDVLVRAWNDENGNGTWDGAEQPLPSIRMQISPGSPEGTDGVTDSYGQVSLFTTVGAFTVTCVPPDSMVVTNANPQSGTMTNGGSATVSFGLSHSLVGHITGRVYVDANRNGVLDGSEAGIADVWVGATKDGGVTLSGYAYTDASGNYDVKVPVNDPPHTLAYSVYVVPPPGYFPTGATSLGNLWVQNATTVGNNNFGMANFQIIRLTANRVLSLTAADVIEADWNGSHTENARQDQDLILGADAGSTDNISVWFNQYARSPLFSTTPTNPDGYTRLAPSSVLAMAVDTLDQNGNHARPDLVTGTRYTPSGNFFVWFNQGTSNNEGYFPATYSTGRNYTTSDAGDVQAVVTMDVGGGAMPDIIVGTKSPVAGQGRIEVWVSDDATTPSYTRDETITLAYSGQIGEITGMTLADIDNDGDKDLLVTARTSDYNGQMFVFENAGRTAGARFIPRYGVYFGGNTPTAVAVLDSDGDGWKDIFVGCQRSTSQGTIYQFRNTGFTTLWSFSIIKAVSPPGFVTSMNAADFGGAPGRTDLAVGYRTSTTGYGGGLMLYFMDLGNIPSTGVDPSGGSIVNMVPALASANFNFGLNTTAPPTPYLMDLAAGVKAGPDTGALVVFIR